MRKTNRIILWLMMATTALPTPVLAGAGRSGMSFLRLSPWARSAGMAEATTAYVGDVGVIHSNPAGLAHITAREVTLEHVQQLDDATYDVFSTAVPTRRGGWGVSAGSLSVNNIPKTRTSASAFDRFVEDGTVTAGDQLLSFSRGWRATRNMAAGFTVKAVREQLDTRSAYSAQADAGFIHRFDYMWRLAGAVQNLGSPVKFNSQSYLPPARARLGLYYFPQEWLESEVDLLYHWDGSPEVLAGFETNWEQIAFLRAGYRYRFHEMETGSSLTGLSAGVGLKWGAFRADYAYMPFGDLGDSHRLAVTWRFLGDKKKQ